MKLTDAQAKVLSAMVVDGYELHHDMTIAGYYSLYKPGDTVPVHGSTAYALFGKGFVKTVLRKWPYEISRITPAGREALRGWGQHGKK